MHSATVALSISLFWPAPDCRPEVLPKRRRRRRKRRPKATSSLVPVTSTASVKVGCNPPKPLSVATPTLNSDNHHPALSSSLCSNNTEGDSSRSEKTDSDASVKESEEKDESVRRLIVTMRKGTHGQKSLAEGRQCIYLLAGSYISLHN